MSILVGVIANKLLILLKQELSESEPEIKEMLMAQFDKIFGHLETLAKPVNEQKLSAILSSKDKKDAKVLNNL